MQKPIVTMADVIYSVQARPGSKERSVHYERFNSRIKDHKGFMFACARPEHFARYANSYLRRQGFNEVTIMDVEIVSMMEIKVDPMRKKRKQKRFVGRSLSHNKSARKVRPPRTGFTMLERADSLKVLDQLSDKLG